MSAAAFPANGALLSGFSRGDVGGVRGSDWEACGRASRPVLFCCSVSHGRKGWDEGWMALGLGFAA